MSYIPNNITKQNKEKLININDIFNDDNNDNINQSTNQNNTNQFVNNSMNTNQNTNQNNNIDPIQEQFKRMSERHKQKKLQEEQRKKEEINNNQNNIEKKDNINNTNNDNNEEINEKNDKQNNIDYIKIIESDLDIQTQHKNHLLNLIFDDYTIIYIQYYKYKLKLRSLITIDSEQAYKSASNYSENQFYSMYQLFILSYALLEIDDYIFSNHDECLEFLYKLPYKDINKLYTVFYENIKKQNAIINNIGYFYDLVNEPFFRMKYKVMKAFNCLPTEKRCKQLNDAQWLWLYYNLEEDMFEKMDETQDNLDYIGFYLNSDAAKKIMKHNQEYRKKRDQKRKARFANTNDTNNTNNKKQENTTVNQVLDNFFTSTPVTNDNTVYNTAFEQELAAAIGTTDISKFTEISDDNEAGNPFESEEDFMERVKTFAPVAGTNYGYIKPEKPPKIRVARKENYSPNANLDNNGESRIQHYLRNTVKQQQLKNANINPLPIQNDLKSLNKNLVNNSINNSNNQNNNIQALNKNFNKNFNNDTKHNNNISIPSNNSNINSVQINPSKQVNLSQQINTNIDNNNQFNTNRFNNQTSINNNQFNNNIPIPNKKIDKQQIIDTRKQQADLEFMHKMNITNLQEMEDFKNIQDNNKDLDFIEFDDE